MAHLTPRGRGNIDVQGVSRSFSGRSVLRDATLTASAGEVVALVGANGCGKTSLLRVLAGVLSANGGVVRISGAEPGKGLSSFVPAGDRMLNWRLSGIHNLMFFASLAGAPRPQADGWIDEAARRLGASDLLPVRMGECSTGQRRRLMLASAFIGGAPVVLLDEPGEDLDEAGQRAISAAMRWWADLGGVCVFAAPRVKPFVPDRVLEIVDGVLAEVGP